MHYFVYILASRKNGTLYIGVTNDVARRVWEHRQGKGSIFARKYKVHRLVYVEAFEEIDRAIQREKTMKEWPRAWKIRVIEERNPDWNDLYNDLLR
ncbi:MAG: GIY-YIG nuclease family protein [Rhizobiales bacterium]|nr:GIY-YIG nuclease family protein [Hyphomicrobiales bacterium]